MSSALHDRTIIHVDLDSFYVAVALRDRPELSGKPVGIQQKNIVVTCNYEARRHGVGKLMLISEAMRLCPSLVLVDGSDLTLFREASSAIFALLQQHAPAGTVIEKLVLEEFWCDVSAWATQQAQQAAAAACSKRASWPGHVVDALDGASTTAGSAAAGEAVADRCGCGCVQRLFAAAQLASILRQRVHSVLGYSCSAGVSVSKQASKLATGLHKPNDQTALLPWAIAPLLLTLPVSSLPGVGYKTNQKLASLSVTTVAQLFKLPALPLAAALGVSQAAAATLLQLARGVDPTPVVAAGPPHTISEEDSFPSCTQWEEAATCAGQQLAALCRRVLVDAAAHARAPTALRVTIRPKAGKRTSKQTRMPVPLPAVPTSSSTDAATIAAAAARYAIALRPHVLSLLQALLNSCTGSSGGGIGDGAFNLTLINVAVLYTVPGAATGNGAGDTSGGLHSYFARSGSGSGGGGGSGSGSGAGAAASRVIDLMDDEEEGEEAAEADEDIDDGESDSEMVAAPAQSPIAAAAAAAASSSSAAAATSTSRSTSTSTAVSPCAAHLDMRYLATLPQWLQEAALRECARQDQRAAAASAEH